jgi:hypothetical protein
MLEVTLAKPGPFIKGMLKNFEAIRMLLLVDVEQSEIVRIGMQFIRKLIKVAFEYLDTFLISLLLIEFPDTGPHVCIL